MAVEPAGKVYPAATRFGILISLPGKTVAVCVDASDIVTVRVEAPSFTERPVGNLRITLASPFRAWLVVKLTVRSVTRWTR